MTYLIGLDIDGVCYTYDRSARYMLRERLARRGDPVPPELFTPSISWNSVEDVVSPEDWKWLYSGGVEEGLFRYGDVVGGAIYGVQDLNELGDVIAITSRPKQAVHDTLVWLSTMFDKAPLAGLHILSHGQKKSEVRPRPNIYIDDAMHNIDEILLNTPSHVRAILFDQPWNQGYEADRLIGRSRWRRAYGWPDVVRLVASDKAGGPWADQRP